jgi:hypothetical protein
LKKKFTQHNDHSIDEYRNQTTGDFVPVKVGQRMKSVISFTLMLECGASDLKIDEDTKVILKDNNYDYESVEVLRKFKSEQLETILKNAVDLKYKVSLAKGIQICLEVIMIFLLMLSIVLKSNVVSLFYFVFVIRSVRTSLKTSLLVRVNLYVSIIFAIQYLLYTLNLTSSSSPAPYPIGFEKYP